MNKLFFLCILSGIIFLVGCSETLKSKVEISEYETPVIDTIPDDTNGEIVTSNEEPLIEDIQNTDNTEEVIYPIAVEVGYDYYDDLDGDGKKEYIFYSALADEYGYGKSLSFIIRDREYVSMLEQDVYLVRPSEHYYITDLDKSDGFHEIALLDYGPSEDLVSYFFRFKQDTMEYIGSVSGLVGDETFEMDGNGRIVSSGRLQVLQTWYAPFWYVLNKEGKIELLVEELYVPYQYESDEKINLLKDIIIYEERSLNSKKTLLMSGDQAIVFTKTDNLDWVFLERADGVKGWLNLSYYDKLRFGEDGDSYQEIFSGLIYAD